MTRPVRVRPRRSLGQNFLRDDNTARKIVRAIDPRHGQVLLEIGPGEGALTGHLAALAQKLIIVELDDRVVARLRDELPASVILLHADVLDVDLEQLAEEHGRLRVVGNIPYNITSPILFHVLDRRASVVDVTLLMQREVARRLVASPRTKEYGILSVLCQMLTDPVILFDVPPTVFFPRPKVMSSLVRLAVRPAPRHPLLDEQTFRTVVRAAFGKRRKTLRNALRDLLGFPTPLPAWLDPARRAEELTLEEFAALANACVPLISPPRESHL
jgi:16S rRNA (adenine1518-N6/adenine1519-N6)-dimethyltransferase